MQANLHYPTSLVYYISHVEGDPFNTDEVGDVDRYVNLFILIGRGMCLTMFDKKEYIFPYIAPSIFYMLHLIVERSMDPVAHKVTFIQTCTQFII